MLFILTSFISFTFSFPIFVNFKVFPKSIYQEVNRLIKYSMMVKDVTQ